MTKKKPVIGICANYSADEGVGLETNLGMKGQEWQLLANDYVEAIEKAGGLPIILPVTKTTETTTEILNMLDGILFTGGTDIDPYYYHEHPKYGLQRIDIKRDKHELDLMDEVLNNTELPVLGICRGLQLLTVATGGKLYQDIRLEKKDSFNHSVPHLSKHQKSHIVSITKGSILNKAFKQTELRVNSFHHQAIKKLGDGFTATMIAPDGIIEGIERKGSRFICAVQWHPETLVENDAIYLNLFTTFIDHCKNE